jgi:hypothetical protein
MRDSIAVPSLGEYTTNLLFSAFVSLRTCKVSVTDSRGVEHAVEVVADSLFEAAALGLQVLRTDGWTEPIGGSTRIEVEVRQPVTKHAVTLMQIQKWLDGATQSPNERVKKDRLKRLLVGR